MKVLFASLFVAFFAVFWACRSPDPQTPPNSPLPTVDRPEDPKPPPSPDLGQLRDSGK